MWIPVPDTLGAFRRNRLREGPRVTQPPCVSPDFPPTEQAFSFGDVFQILLGDYVTRVKLNSSKDTSVRQVYELGQTGLIKVIAKCIIFEGLPLRCLDVLRGRDADGFADQ